METNNNIEVILLSKFSLTNSRQNEIVKWLATTVQSAIANQHEATKKLSLRILKDTPAIFMS